MNANAPFHGLSFPINVDALYSTAVHRLHGWRPSHLALRFLHSLHAFLVRGTSATSRIDNLGMAILEVEVLGETDSESGFEAISTKMKLPTPQMMVIVMGSCLRKCTITE